MESFMEEIFVPLVLLTVGDVFEVGIHYHLRKYSIKEECCFIYAHIYMSLILIRKWPKRVSDIQKPETCLILFSTKMILFCISALIY